MNCLIYTVSRLRKEPSVKHRSTSCTVFIRSTSSIVAPQQIAVDAGLAFQTTFKKNTDFILFFLNIINIRKLIIKLTSPPLTKSRTK